MRHYVVQSVLKVEDTLWLGTDNGLNIVDLNTQRVTVFPVSEDGQVHLDASTGFEYLLVGESTFQRNAKKAHVHKKAQGTCEDKNRR